MKKQTPLNLSADNIKKAIPPGEQMVETMADFYTTIGNCLLNMVASQNAIAESLNELSIDISYLVENSNKRGVNEGYLSQLEVEERDTPEDEPPANARN